MISKFERLTGRVRYRWEQRLFRPDLFVLQVEATKLIDATVALDEGSQPSLIYSATEVVWRDARPGDAINQLDLNNVYRGES